MDTNLPITPIWDLVVKGTDLVAATHGRAFWILDDITPLHQLQPSIVDKAAHLMKPRDTVRFRLYGRSQGKSKTNTNYKMTGPVTVAFRRVETPSGTVQEQFLDAGRNPPDGVIVHYWLREPSDGLRLAILDADGNEVRSFVPKRDKKAAAPEQTDAEAEVQQVTGAEEPAAEEPESEEEEGPYAPNAAGMNRFVWDYRYTKPVKIEGGSRGSREEALENVGGPRAVPGRYQVRLTVGEEVFTESFELLADPRLPVSEADLRAQFELKVKIRDATSETNTAINKVRKLRQQVEDWEKRASGRKSITDAAAALKKDMRAIEAELINVDFEKPRPGPNRIKEKLDSLSSMIDESDDVPTRGAYEVYDMLHSQLETQLSNLRSLVDGPVAAFNALIREEGVPAVGI
jgi:hypothetical protein